ncbi:MAG: flagellar export protein FliJ [Ruminococcus sp.]|nr:flagellar export protein FliJ [Ruminococcus sp.]
MKKFRFTLDKLLDYKGQILDREKNDLAALNLARADALELKAGLEAEQRRNRDDFNRKAAGGISPADMLTFTNYHNVLQMRIEDTQREIEELEEKIARQLNVVTEASKEVKSLEKLEEKQLEDYRFKVQKSEENFIEEYVNGAAVRQLIANS